MAPVQSGTDHSGTERADPARSAVNLAELAVLALVGTVIVVFFWNVHSYSPAARLVPLIFLYIGAGLLGLRTFFVLRRVMTGSGSTLPVRPDWRVVLRTSAVIGAVIGYLVLIHLIGLYPAIPVVVFLFAALLGGLRWYTAAAIAAGTWLFTWLLFVRLLGLPSLPGAIWS